MDDDDDRRKRSSAQPRRSDEEPARKLQLKPGAYSLAQLQGEPHSVPGGSIGKFTLSDRLPEVGEPSRYVQRAATAMWPQPPAQRASAAVEAAATGTGEPLAAPTRARFERSLGVDLGDVRVHTHAAAAAAAGGLGARAYASGQDIFFGAGEYNPGGDLLLAHEVAHTVQQRGGSPGLQPKLEVSSPGDPLESEADRAADAMMSGQPALVSAAGGVVATKLWRWQTASGMPHQEHELGPQGFKIEGDYIRVERVWFEQQYKSHQLEENKKILDALETSSMPWIKDLSAADKQTAAQHIELKVVFDEGQDIGIAPIRKGVMAWVGLPPGEKTFWQFPLAPASPTAAKDAPKPRSATLFIAGSEYTPAENGGRQFSVALMNEMVDRLEAAVGAKVLPGVRENAVKDGTLLPPNARMIGKAIVLPHSRERMIDIFGEGAWGIYEKKADSEGEIAAGNSQTGGVTADPGVSQVDAEFVKKMLEEINKGGAAADPKGPSLKITAQLVSALREIDAHPKRAEIMAALQAPATSTPKDADEDMASRLRRVMYAVDLKEEQKRLGITGKADERKRPFPWPVQGNIVNHTDLLFTGKTAEFSVNITSTEQQPLMVVVPWVNVHWVIRQIATKDANITPKEVDRGHTRHQHKLEPPKHYEMSFGSVGTYEVNALVDHDDFLPNHFTIPVEVKTEGERFKELEDRTYGPSNLWGDIDKTTLDENHKFDEASITDSHDHGKTYEGKMPLICKPGQPMPGDKLKQQIANIRAYIASGKATPDEMKWASEYLEQMEGTQKKVDEELKNGNSHMLNVQGVYLSRSADGHSQDLALTAIAKHENNKWTISIYDTTQAYDTRNSHFSESDENYKKAAEKTFTNLCKSYPRGQMSLRIEMLDDNGAPTGRFAGFELDCDSTWEAVRRTVWNPYVQVVVNIAGAAVAVFLPFTAPFIVPTLIAYNTIETVANVVDLGRRDALTWEDVGIAIGQIAMDVIPYVGQATKVIKVGTTLYHVFEGLMLAGEMVMMTAQMTEQVQTIRFGVMRQIAELNAQIQTLEQQNPSDPSLPGLRQQFEELRKQAATAWETTLASTAGQYAIMRASSKVIHGISEHQAHMDAASRSAINDALHARGSQPIHAGDIPHLERVMGVKVEMTGTKGDVKIQYEVGKLGGIKDVRIVVGPEANLSMLMHHEPVLRSMQRYAGLTGSLNNLLERIDAYRKGGGHIPPGSKAFEAHFELQKLPPIIESLKTELTSHPIGSETAQRIEGQIKSLEEQLAQHAKALDDLAPGLGYVAAKDGAPDPNAKMGEAPPTPGAPTATTAAKTGAHAWPPPTGRSPTEHARLVKKRGSATVPHDGKLPNTWTGTDEALFRYGDKAKAPDGYHWSTDPNGTPYVVRDREVDASGQTVPRRTYSETPVVEDGQQTHFPTISDDIAHHAKFVAGTEGVLTETHNLSPAAQKEANKTIAERNAAIKARDKADQSLTGLSRELKVTEDDLSSDKLPKTLDKLRQEHAGDKAALEKVNQLERQAKELSKQRDAVVAASEKLGHQMAVDYMKSKYKNAQLVFGSASDRGKAGEFDFVFFVPDQPAGRGTFVVVEAKGGSSKIGTRRTSSGVAQQGSLQYMQEIARVMRPKVEDEQLARALDAMLDTGNPKMPAVSYLLVEAPIDADGVLKPGRVREFDLTQ